MRKLYWYLTAYLRKRGIVFVLAVILGIVVFSAVLPSVLKRIDQKQVQYTGLIGAFQLDTLPARVRQELSAGLTTINPDNSVSPLLAQRWAVEQEGKSYRFLIKENLHWNDGTLLTPDDIQYSFPDVERIVTEQDVVFSLPSPFAPFPSLVSDPLLKRGTLTTHFLMRKPTLLGIGPNKIADYTSNGNWLSDITIEGPEKKHVYRFFRTESDAVTAYKMGQVDELPELFEKPELEGWENSSVSATVAENRYVATFFNHRDVRLQKNVRQALSYATAKPDESRRAYGPIPPSSWAFFPGVKEYEQDTDRALDRLFDEIPREKLEFTLTTTPLYAGLAGQLKTQWEELGQKAEARCQADSKISDKTLCPNFAITINERIVSVPDKNDFDLLLIGQTTPPDPDQYSLWHSDQAGNFSGYKNTRIDTLLEKGRQVEKQADRTEIYQEFQQYLLEDAAAIFLERPLVYSITRQQPWQS